MAQGNCQTTHTTAGSGGSASHQAALDHPPSWPVVDIEESLSYARVLFLHHVTNNLLAGEIHIDLNFSRACLLLTPIDAFENYTLHQKIELN